MKDYFVYLPRQHRETVWGCTLSSAGYTRTRPGAPYPPFRHPTDHHFTWAHGRFLNTYQIVFITEGTGDLESGTDRNRQRIEAGTVFLLFPGVWHRYAPDRRTGWVEQWIECSGPAFDQARAEGLIRPERAVYSVGLHPGLTRAFNLVHDLAQSSAGTPQAQLSTLGLHILAILEDLATANNEGQRALDLMVRRAQEFISGACDQPLRMVALARKLGVGYTHFRKAFRQSTGMTPKQYHLEARLHEAQKRLANTDQTLQEIADALGFNSAFHLSRQFKDRTGHAPRTWRQQFHHPVHRPPPRPGKARD